MHRVTVATLLVAIMLIFKRAAGLAPKREILRSRVVASSLVIAFLLSIYGGFFSGGYTTLMTYLFVFGLGLTFLEAAAATSLLSIFSGEAASILLGQEVQLTIRSEYRWLAFS